MKTKCHFNIHYFEWFSFLQSTEANVWNCLMSWSNSRNRSGLSTDAKREKVTIHLNSVMIVTPFLVLKYEIKLFYRSKKTSLVSEYRYLSDVVMRYASTEASVSTGIPFSHPITPQHLFWTSTLPQESNAAVKDNQHKTPRTSADWDFFPLQDLILLNFFFLPLSLFIFWTNCEFKYLKYVLKTSLNPRRDRDLTASGKLCAQQLRYRPKMFFTRWSFLFGLKVFLGHLALNKHEQFVLFF